MRRLILALLLAGCGPEELIGGASFVCEEIGRTVANVSWGCGMDLEKANARGRGFVDAFVCDGPVTNIGEYILEVGLACPVAMAQTPCDVASGELKTWIAAVPSCTGIASPK